MTLAQFLIGLCLALASTAVVAMLLFGDPRFRAFQPGTRVGLCTLFLVGGILGLLWVDSWGLAGWLGPVAVLGGQLGAMGLLLALTLIAGTLVSRYRRKRQNVEIGDGEPPVVGLVNQILVNAIREKAQAIMIDCDEDESRVVFHIEGSPRVVMTPPRNMHPHIIGRIMLMAGLGYSEQGLISDGHIHLLIGKDQERFFSVHLRPGSTDQPAALIELLDDVDPSKL